MNHSQLYDIGLKKKNGELKESWKELAIKHSDGFFSDGESYRLWVKNRLRQRKEVNNTKVAVDKSENFNESIEINKDGTQSSNKLLRMSIEDCKDANYLLSSHGYDTNVWELISARNNIWNSYSKKDGIMTLYSSKISVKPRVNNNDISKLIENIKYVKPYDIKIERITVDEKRLLEIPLFDAHFGISNYEYYKPTQAQIMEYINYRKWDEILFIIGQDLFHNNDFKGHTANGTPIESVDMQKAWEDCCKFYEPLIQQAIEKQSKRVKIMYSKGNHDETIGWAFVKYLEARFPKVTFDTDFEERKIHTFGDIFLGVTHGDKANNKDLVNIFIKDFSLDWANANTREIHKGHYHVEDGKDVFGTMVRTLATKNKTDQWHKDKGFIGAHKRFMLFEYNETELKSIHYV